MLELTGENFTPHLKVWFGDVEAETLHRSDSIYIDLFLFFTLFSILLGFINVKRSSGRVLDS